MLAAIHAVFVLGLASATAPGEARTEDQFLHAIEVGPQSTSAMVPVELVKDGDSRGVRLQTTKGTWVVLFRTTGQLGGRIQRTGTERPIDLALDNTVTPQSGIMARSK